MEDGCTLYAVCVVVVCDVMEINFQRLIHWRGDSLDILSRYRYMYSVTNKRE